MKSPFALIKVQSEGAKRLAWLCAVVAVISVLIVALIASDGMGRISVSEWLLIVGLWSVLAFFVSGYLVLGIAWVIEGFRKKDSK